LGNCLTESKIVCSHVLQIDIGKIENCLPLAEIEIGTTATECLKKIPVPKQKAIQLQINTFYTTTVKYLQTRLPLCNKFLSNVSSLAVFNWKTSSGEVSF
jgi:hypothetical protein